MKGWVIVTLAFNRNSFSVAVRAIKTVTRALGGELEEARLGGDEELSFKAAETDKSDRPHRSQSPFRQVSGSLIKCFFFLFSKP